MKTKLIHLITITALVTLPMISHAGSAEEVWMKNCKKCHGADGKGDTPMGKKFEVRDYTDAAVQASLTDEAIKASIVDGVTNEDGKKVMMAFGNKLSDEEADALVAYLRSLKAE
jgi:mono/diheme cytochrome c family protein